MSFFIAWRWNVERNNDSGNIKKSQSDREWRDFMKMISLALPKTGYGHMRQLIGANRNITVKIETPAGFQ